MVIDCDTCAVRDLACQDCVVTVLLGTPPVRGTGPRATGGVVEAPLDLAAEDHRAIDVLADAGMVPRLRLVPTRRADPAGPGAARAG